MRFILSASMVIATCYASNSYSAPVPKDTKAIGCEYQPNQKGTVWTYEFSKGVVETRKITKNEVRDGSVLLTIEVSPARNGDKYTLDIEANKSGIFMLAFDNVKYDPADMLFSMPFKAQAEWKRLPQKSDKAKVSHKCGIIEEVSVPFGTFKCILIDTTTTEASVAMDERTWYASGVGIIKYESRLQSGLWSTMQLKTFKLGK